MGKDDVPIGQNLEQLVRSDRIDARHKNVSKIINLHARIGLLLLVAVTFASGLRQKTAVRGFEGALFNPGQLRMNPLLRDWCPPHSRTVPAVPVYSSRFCPDSRRVDVHLFSDLCAGFQHIA